MTTDHVDPEVQIKTRPDDPDQADLLTSLLDGVEPGTYVLASIEDIVTEVRGAWSRSLCANPTGVRHGRFLYELIRGLMLDDLVHVIAPPQPERIEVSA